MSLQRASVSMLRTRLRATAATAPLRRLQVRNQSHIKKDGDLGGPGGQQPPPQAPGGPEAVKRNWLPISGGALLVLASFWYLTSSDIPKPERTREGDLRAASSTEIGAMPPPSGRSIAKALEDKESAALGELSGRKGREGMGAFRAE